MSEFFGTFKAMYHATYCSKIWGYLDVTFMIYDFIANVVSIHDAILMLRRPSAASIKK